MFSYVQCGVCATNRHTFFLQFTVIKTKNFVSSSNYALSKSLEYVLFCVRFPYNNQLSLMCSLIKCFLKNAYCPRHSLIYHSSLIFKELYQLSYARHSYYMVIVAGFSGIRLNLVVSWQLQQNCFQYVLRMLN